MKNGFVKVAAATPDIRVADVEFNTQNIINAMEEAQKNGAKILVFPELCVTGYTCSDLFDHSVLLKASRKALLEIAENTNDKDMLVFVGAPLEVNGKLYNVAAAMNQGEIIGFTTKTFLPNYGEFYEMRQFTPGPQTVRKEDSIRSADSLPGRRNGRTGSGSRDLRGCLVTDPAEYSGGT